MSRWQPITVVETRDNEITIRTKGKYEANREEEQQSTWYSPTESSIDLESERKFMAQVESRKGLIVADGSYKDGRSSAAIVVQHQRTEIIETNSTHCLFIY